MQVLIVDDDAGVRKLLCYALGQEGYTTSTAEGGEEAIRLAREQSFDLIFCDVRMGGVGGFDVLRILKEEIHSDADIILMTGYASVEAALEAVCAGARDYLVKPFSVDDVLTLAQSAAERRRAAKLASAQTEPASEYADLVGRSAPMIEVLKTVGRVATTELPVLICGESGTGKEVIARTIHARSNRSSRPFVALNCGALTETLLDSELFGYVRGSFTGANSDHRGLFEEASGGTILLDEITETSAAFQVKLLRTLQEGEIRRVGSNLPIKVNVRVIATTNRDVDQAIAEGGFRSDLLYRLNAVTIKLPPLRERADDVDLMLSAFLRHFRKPGAPPMRITPEAREQLNAYRWPGNVRELRHTIHRLVALNTDGIITSEDLPLSIRSSTEQLDSLLSRSGDESRPGGARGDSEWVQLSELEARYLVRVLHHTSGNAKRAAEIMGVDRKTLARMIERHAVDVDTIRLEAKS